MSRRTSEADKAIRAAWERERELVNNGQGTRDWSPKHQTDILERGKAYDDDGKAFEGHHMKSVEAYPEYQGESDNIQFLSRPEHRFAHSGNFQIPTNGYYDPITGHTTVFGNNIFTPCEIIKLSNPINCSKLTPDEPLNTEPLHKANSDNLQLQDIKPAVRNNEELPKGKHGIKLKELIQAAKGSKVGQLFIKYKAPITQGLRIIGAIAVLWGVQKLSESSNNPVNDDIANNTEYDWSSLLSHSSDDMAVANEVDGTDDYSCNDWAAESELHKRGYSVAKNSGLSESQRQELLKNSIEDGSISKDDTIAYLKHLINFNGKKKSNSIAAEKWENDLEFVEHLD